MAYDATDEEQLSAQLSKEWALFELWAIQQGHRDFTKSGSGYRAPEVQRDWLAFVGGYAAAESSSRDANAHNG